MLGAIIGDIVGSTREWHNIKTEDFELVPKGSRFTDDTVMTLAVAEWLMTDPEHQPETLVACMQRLGMKYPNAGYGKMFSQWLVSDHPQPYNSFGNGSAMRVSPVGLYANSLEEALELARITASVSHNHPEGIKGAQAIAGCVFLHKNISLGAEDKIRHFITKEIGYNLDFSLDDIRGAYSFDVTCQGSVPIAIKAYLERSGYPAEKALRLAISMGGDSDTIGTMTASIASAASFSVIGGGFREELVNQCRALLPADLLDINDRFEAFVSRPLHQSYYIGGKLFAGEYPGDKYGELAEAKLKRMHHFGVRHFVDLTEGGELRPYRQLLPNDTTYLRFPIQDVNVPKSVEAVHQLIDKMEYMMQQDGYTYIHCWGGVGRTGTIVACYKARQMEEPTLENALTAMRNNFAKMPKASHRKSPETQEQIDFVRLFVESCKQRKEQLKWRTKDRIRGSLMAGAAGDALGYTVEFMRRKSIIAQYGNKGITQFDLTSDGKALVSDDTQMTLFTACGMLMGVTRGYMRGIGGQPEKYVDGAYLDWYYTQTGKKKEILINDFHYTWLRDLPELAHRRAPGNTCLSACESLFQGKEVQNNSKGCGGIMRVAPMALLMAGYWSRGGSFYNVLQMDEAGAEVAAVTHKHPLAFLPSAMLTHLIYSVIRMEEDEIKANMADIALETIGALDHIYKGEYKEDKRYLANLTRMAVTLAANDKSDADNIRMLGEGWTGEEAWAIALYCAVRHVGSMEEALIAAVNHDGDSDSTGAVCGNIMGAIYGYEAMKRKRLFCPQGKELEQTLELSDIILALADDLYTSCIISEYDPIETPEKRQWYDRYCEMKPVGLNKKLMYNREYTPERISELKENEIFVFGSNLAGAHGGGAARLAYERFGAVWGEGVGLHGQTYAIPTMQGGVETIKPYVDAFIRFAKEHSRLTFLVTRIGCGIAGFRDEEIAPLFKDAIEVENIILPKEFVACLVKNVTQTTMDDGITWDSNVFLAKYTPLIQKANNGDHIAYYKVKELRAQEYRNTIEIVNQGFYTTEEGQRVQFPILTRMEHETTFYSRAFRVDDIAVRPKATQVIVRNVDCLEEGVRLTHEGYNPAVLNMASRRNPGGGVMTGAGAQEETLFRRTNLFRSLYQFTEYFTNHVWYAKYITPVRTGERYPLERNFGGIYTPGALLFREDEYHGYKLMDSPERLSFISVAGINRPDLKDTTHLADNMIEGTKNKMRTILRIGLRHGHDSLVLGALGCGAFCNPPSHIAQLFHEVFEEPEFKNKYRLISFAILDDHNTHRSHNPEGNYLPFVKEFCK